MRNVAVLGATGSIGGNTLDVIARHPERFRASVLTAHRQVEELVALCVRHRPELAVIADPALEADLSRRLAAAGVRCEVASGHAALTAAAAGNLCDTVVAAIVGAAGLESTLAAARAGKRLLLANKESIVMAGPLLLAAVAAGGGALIPVDSEHNAIFQCLPGGRPDLYRSGVRRLILTASGGPFRGRTRAELADITPDQACKHPNWVMGRKISVDSATMMNKAHEVIEARWLLDLAPEQIEVVIHPQSVVHSMVVCRDHSVLAQLGTADMRVPIAYGLAHPERIESGASPLDFATLGALSFAPADPARFPGLGLAFDALRGPAGSTAVLNAANEEAVAAFLAGTIRFDQIHTVNAGTVDAVSAEPGAAGSVDALLDLDARARGRAVQFVKDLAS